MSKKEGIKITDFETVLLVDRRVFIAKTLLQFRPISANIEYYVVKTNILYWFATVSGFLETSVGLSINNIVGKGVLNRQLRGRSQTTFTRRGG